MQRQDNGPDEVCYAAPRSATDIDDETIDAITQVYRESFSAEHELLDLMSSWISHLPPEMSFRKIAGLGMNQEELDAALTAIREEIEKALADGKPVVLI